jgi:dihydroorotate dehydrogenase
MYRLLREGLFRLPAEAAHDLGLLGIDLAGRWLAAAPQSLPVQAFGLDFPNPVGLAAGLDKNGDHIDALAALGFGFIEIGTVTPRPQPGNPKPRMFRLPRAQAVINRLGFNNLGIDHLCRQVRRSRWHADGGLLGVNIGKNRDTPQDQANEDYLVCLRRAYPLASYVTVNISSPNTAGLRDLQHGEAFAALLDALQEERERMRARHDRRVPLLIKLAPDLDEAAIDDAAARLNDSDIDGVICGNTTLSRPEALLGLAHADEAGGLSGAPLRPLADATLKAFRERLRADLPLVGTGGIVCGADAARKIALGATLVQFYTGLIYAGPRLVADAVDAIAAARAD